MSEDFVMWPRPPSIIVEIFVWWKGQISELLGRKKIPRKRWADSPPNITIMRNGVQIGTASEIVAAAELPSFQTTERFGKQIHIGLALNGAVRRRLGEQRIPLLRAHNMAELDIVANTPFDLKQVYICFFTQSDEVAQTTDYFIVRRDLLDPVLNWARSRRFEICAVSIVDNGVRQFAQPYVVEGLNSSKKTLRSLKRNCFTFLLLILVGTIFFNYILAVESASNAVERKIEELEPSAVKARAALKSRSVQLARLQALYSERKNYYPLSQTLEELSRILPDGTYISSLSSEGNKVRISGFSNAAAGLVALIDSSSLFKNPRFTSAITKIPELGNDQFSMQIEVGHVH